MNMNEDYLLVAIFQWLHHWRRICLSIPLQQLAPTAPQVGVGPQVPTPIHDVMLMGLSWTGVTAAMSVSAMPHLMTAFPSTSSYSVVLPSVKMFSAPGRGYYRCPL